MGCWAEIHNLERCKHLKGQFHEVFDLYFLLKRLYLGPNEQDKTFSHTKKISRRYSITMCVRLVNDYTDKQF